MTVYKWNDGVNSVTPPGHWNLIAQPYIKGAGWQRSSCGAGARVAQYGAA
jgi:hypothetical protein